MHKTEPTTLGLLMSEHDGTGQLKLFASAADTTTHGRSSSQEKKSEEPTSHEWWIYIDGASRKNPGLAGAGIYVLKDGVPLYQEGYFLGVRTNNQAEYLAFLLGIFTLKKWWGHQDRVRLFSDSQLLVRQLCGTYKVRNELLKPLHRVAQHMVQDMRADVAHVMREDNVHADKMANRGIDTKKPIPPAFVRMLHSYEVAL